MGIVHTHAQMVANPLPIELRFYASLADTYPFIETAQPADPTRKGFIVREPVGVSALIVPWNAPLLLIVSKWPQHCWRAALSSSRIRPKPPAKAI